MSRRSPGTSLPVAASLGRDRHYPAAASTMDVSDCLDGLRRRFALRSRRRTHPAGRDHRGSPRFLTIPCMRLPRALTPVRRTGLALAPSPLSRSRQVNPVRPRRMVISGLNPFTCVVADALPSLSFAGQVTLDDVRGGVGWLARPYPSRTCTGKNRQASPGALTCPCIALYCHVLPVPVLPIHHPVDESGVSRFRLDICLMHAGGLRPRGAWSGLALATAPMWPSEPGNVVGAPKEIFRGSIHRLHEPRANAYAPPLRRARHSQGPAWRAKPSPYGTQSS